MERGTQPSEEETNNLTRSKKKVKVKTNDWKRALVEEHEKKSRVFFEERRNSS